MDNTDLIYDVKRKMLAKYPRFGSEIARVNIEFEDDLSCPTAASDGKNIYVNPNYFKSLSENDKLFLIAHETMHIKFMHMFRLKDKDGNDRDLELWNIATDAVINANLERDGFTIKEGYVNMPEALNYSAEEFYQKLLEEKQQNNEQGQKQNNDQEREKQQGDDHTLWEEAFKNQQQEANSEENEESLEEQQGNDSKENEESLEEQQGNDSKENEKSFEEQEEFDIDEKKEFEDNREEKRKKFKEKCAKTKHDIREKQEETIKLENIGKSKDDIDWKVLVRREIEKSETVWSQRRSIAENNYAYRLEENDIEDEAETEVMIDISGSVDLDLVKAFLRQLKPLLKESKLRVGCFNEKFWGFIDIKNVRDIDNFTMPKGSRNSSFCGTDLDLPVRSFTKKREINKIVFTDGYANECNMPKDDLKKENVIWLVYGNKDFKPCCGKVINITEEQLERLNLISKHIYKEDVSR